MKIKNATIFGINPKFKMLPTEVEAHQFLPITDLQAESAGWAPVQADALLYGIASQALMYFMLEKKQIPASAIETRLAERAAEIEAAQGFKPGKKALKELKESVIDELLPRALPSRSRTAVWIDRKNHRLVIDSASNSVVSAVLRLLHKTFDDLGVADVAWPRTKVVTEWLIDEPAGFTLDDEVALAYPGEHGKTVKFAAADLADDDVQLHIQKHGASVETVAMTFDSRISFVMTANGQIRRIKLLDVITSASEAKDVDRFEGEFALTTLEVGRLIDALVAAA